MIGHKLNLLAGTALVLATTLCGAASAQTAPAQTGPANVPVASENAGVALNTEAATLFRRDRNISVSQRPREGYQALGLHMGGFMAWPKLSATVEHNDNIFATDTDEESDVIYRISPEIAVNSNWSRHAVGAYARAVINRFQDNGSEETEDYSLGVNGRVDVLRDSNLTASADWMQLTEPRTSPDSPGLAAEPVQYDLANFRVAARHTLNRLRLGAVVAVQNFNYDNPDRLGGGVIDQSHRNRTVTAVTARADYAVSPDTAVFLEVTGNKRDYREAGQARDSEGVQVLAGANFELGAVTRGEVAVGYLKQNFDDVAFEDVDGFGARAEVEWFPTQLTTLTFTASRTAEDSAVPGAGVMLSSNLSAKVEHELMRNVILTGRVGYGRDDYDAINRRDERLSFGVSGTYLLNRMVGLTAGYTHEEQETKKGVGKPYEVNKVTGTVTAQF